MRTNHAAGGLFGDHWIARPKNGLLFSRSLGVDVIVKPPTWGMRGMWTSSHWPGRNYTVEVGCKLGCRSMGQVSCLGSFPERSQRQQANVSIKLLDLFQDHWMQAWLTVICCSSLFMARLGCHGSAGGKILLVKPQWSQKLKGGEATSHP